MENRKEFEASRARLNELVMQHGTQSTKRYTKDELVEALDVALVVGGSITIPHVRRAYGKLEELGVLGRG